MNPVPSASASVAGGGGGGGTSPKDEGTSHATASKKASSRVVCLQDVVETQLTSRNGAQPNRTPMAGDCSTNSIFSSLPNFRLENIKRGRLESRRFLSLIEDASNEHLLMELLARHVRLQLKSSFSSEDALDRFDPAKIKDVIDSKPETYGLNSKYLMELCNDG